MRVCEYSIQRSIGDGQSFCFHEFQVKPHGFGNQLFGLIECLARSYTARQLRQIRRIPDLIVALELYLVSHGVAHLKPACH